MNEEHLRLCSSAEWAEAIEKWIIPWVLDGVDLGDHVLEIGPGPGLTTDVIRTRVAHLTAVEIDPALAEALSQRMAGTNVEVLCRDATDTGLASDQFSGAVCMTMLHHVPSAEAQDKLLTEARRVLRPGAMLVGEDSIASPELQALHEDDIYVPIDPDGFEARLRAAGFIEVSVTTNEYAVRFQATKPTSENETRT